MELDISSIVGGIICGILGTLAAILVMKRMKSE